jgi:hypothetical protein
MLGSTYRLTVHSLYNKVRLADKETNLSGGKSRRPHGATRPDRLRPLRHSCKLTSQAAADVLIMQYEYLREYGMRHVPRDATAEQVLVLA